MTRLWLRAASAERQCGPAALIWRSGAPRRPLNFTVRRRSLRWCHA